MFFVTTCKLEKGDMLSQNLLLELNTNTPLLHYFHVTLTIYAAHPTEALKMNDFCLFL